jgi:putative ABC transport system substrate-binding protein
VEGFKAGLRELGYVEGENLIVEWRWADGREDRLAALADELLSLDIDVLVARGTVEGQAAQQATTTVPIVFTMVTDPVGAGLVASLARPGGNITGTSNSIQGMHGKRLDVLVECVPGAKRIAAISYFDVAHAAASTAWEETQTVAQRLGVTLNLHNAIGVPAIPAVLEQARQDRSDAVLYLPAGPVFAGQAARIGELTTQARLPSMGEGRVMVLGGVLFGYGTSGTEITRRAAAYVDRILKGEKAADLPVEQPTTFDFTVNLTTARALGYTLPPSVQQQITEFLQ